jgi:hypothetical protein
MFNAGNPVTLLVPMLVVVVLTYLAFLKLGAARMAALKGGAVDAGYYRAHIGAGEGEAATVANRHYINLFEMPVLFYAACLSGYVLNPGSIWVLGLAWGYVAGRVIQSAVHLTYNNPMHRGMGFFLAVLCLGALWINLALVIFDRL